MVVCKFFQQGYCRFGQSCRFEHIYGSKYSYHAPQHAAPSSATTGVTDEQLMKQVESDVQAVLQGGQWLLSSYAPFKERGAIPGLMDLSFEEARLFIYEAKANNNVDQAVAYINSLFKEAREKYERLLQPTPNIVKTLRAIYNKEAVVSPFTSTSTGNAASVFRSAAQSSLFGQASNTPSPFGQNSSHPASLFRQEAQNVFGQGNALQSIFGSPDPAKSLFAQASENAFASPNSNNVFGPQATNAKSIFSQAAQAQSPFGSPQSNSNASNVFASASQQFFGNTQSSEPFGQKSDPFGQKSDPFGQKSDPFGQKSDPFGQKASPFQTASSNQFEQQSDDPAVYSKMEELSSEDLEAFNSAEFKLGFVPELPPPRVLCV